ncbi:hypothetical protein C817_05165 [Dorea sp. 5-2]|nr:hypothetical protein C817_05165 [Dorea sp. 5-2]
MNLTESEKRLAYQIERSRCIADFGDRTWSRFAVQLPFCCFIFLQRLLCTPI